MPLISRVAIPGHLKSGSSYESEISRRERLALISKYIIIYFGRYKYRLLPVAWHKNQNNRNGFKACIYYLLS
jgi:hypothetical protein